MRHIQAIKKKIQDVMTSKGSFSIEAAIGMMAILMITFLGIAYFTYLAPRQVITQEVQVLTQTAKIQGGLTQEDVNWFKNRMNDRGFETSRVEVEAIAVNINGQKNSVTDVEPLEAGYVHDGDYVSREEKTVINVTVKVPSNSNFINEMSKFWTGSDSSLKDYVFKETIMSERW